MANNTGIRINEIPVNTDLDGETDLVHVYKKVGDSYESVSTPLCAVAFQGPKGDKGEDGIGVDGRSVAQLTCYRRFNPTVYNDTKIKTQFKPGSTYEGVLNDGGSFNFSSMIFTPPTGWHKGVPPINTGEEEYVLYSCTGVAVSADGSVDNSIVWSDPESAGKSMQPGRDGKSTYQAVIFTRSATVPERPYGGYFDFGTDTLGPPLSGTSGIDDRQNPGYQDDNDTTIYNQNDWYVDTGGDLGPPDVSDQLWMCNQQFAIQGDTGADVGALWSIPTRFATDGANGISTYYGSIYKRTNADISQQQPGVVPGGDQNRDSGYYDFRLNKFVFTYTDDNGNLVDLTDYNQPMEGWSEDIPEESSSDRKTLWVSHALATSNASFLGSDDVQDRDLQWSSPVKIQTPAIDGDQGAYVAQVRAFLRAEGDFGPSIDQLSAASFDFGTKLLDLGNSGWSLAPYKTTLDVNDPSYGYDNLWVSIGIATSTPERQDDGSFKYPPDTEINWSDAVPASEDGEAARSTYLAQIYTRTTSAIDTETYRPSGGSFNFNDQTLTVPNTQDGLTWSANIPGGFDPIYVSQRNFSVLGNAGMDVSENSWSTPALLAYNGAPGASGISSIILTLYYGSDVELVGTSQIPNFPEDLTLTVNLSATAGSDTFGKILRSEVNGVSANVTNNQILSGIDGTGWYTQLPDKKWIYATQAVAADSDASDDDYHDTVAGTEWSDTVVYRRPGAHGFTGLGTATVQLYKRTNSTSTPNPTHPSGSITYYLGTVDENARGTIGEAGTEAMQGWTQTPPNFDGSNHYLWQITAVASSRENADTIEPEEWSDPIIFSQNPFDLTETTVSHIVEAYKRSSTLPIDNPGSCTVNLSGELAGQINSSLANNWSTTIPDGDDQVYIVHATASGPVSNINDTDTIDANEWSAPAKWGIVGPVGPRGIPGSIPRAITLYKYTDLTPTQTEIDTPTLSATYDFTTDTVTFGTPYTGANQNAWTYNVPLSDVTDKILWQTSATAFSSVESSQYTLLSSSWNAPIAIGRSGTSIRFLGSYDTYDAFETANDPLSAGYAFYHTGQKESYIVTGFDESNGNAIYQVFSKDQQGTPGVGITYKGEYANNGTVGDHFATPKLNWVYRDTTLSASYIYSDTDDDGTADAWVLFNKDGEPGRSVTGITDYSLTSDGTATEVTLSFSTGNDDTFVIQNGTDAQPLSVVAGSFSKTNGLSGNFQVKLGDNKGNEYSLEVPVSDGDGIDHIQHVDHTSNGVTLGKIIEVWKDSNPYEEDGDGNPLTNPSYTIGPIFDGSDGAAANVAIVYATDVDGLSASYDKTYYDSGVDRTREFVKYFEYNPDDDSISFNTNGKPSISQFRANTGTLSGGFVQWRGDPGAAGTDGSSIVPIYASVRNPQIGTNVHNLSYEQSTGSEGNNDLIERQFVTFYEKAAGFNMPDLTNANNQNFINSQTFVNLKGIRGTSITQVTRDSDPASGSYGTVTVEFDDGTPDSTFTVTDGKDATFVSATRKQATQEVELTFETGGRYETKRFDLNDGTSISSISSREDENGDTIIVVKGKVTGDTSATETDIGTFTVKKGPQGIASKVVVVYAIDADGTDATFTRTSGTNHVKYHEYTGNQPQEGDFKADIGALSGGFVQFVGDPGSSVVPIFAEDSSGSNPSLTQTAAKTFITFYEKPYGTVVDSNTNLVNLISNNNLTFVNIQTPAAGAGLLAYPAYGGTEFEDIKFDADENALVLQSLDGDTTIGMSYPAINVEDAGVVEFDVTFKSDVSASGGVYIRVFEIDTELAEGKLAIAKPNSQLYTPLSIIQTEGVIPQANGTHRDGAHTNYPAGSNGPRGFRGKNGGSGLNMGVTQSYVTSSFRYIPDPSAKYASLEILNWTGLSTNKLFVKPVIPRILGKNIETVQQVAASETLTFTFNDGSTTDVHVPSGREITVTGITRNNDTGSMTMSFSALDIPGSEFSRSFDTRGMGISAVSADQYTDNSGDVFTRLTVIGDDENVINVVDVPNGLPGANSNVAIVYAEDADGTGASYDGANLDYIRYYEYQYHGDNSSKPPVSAFKPENELYSEGSFVKYVGHDGGSITPIYSKVQSPTASGQLSLTPGVGYDYVTFYEKVGGLTSNDLSTEFSTISGETFVKYTGETGAPVIIKGTKSATGNLPSSGQSIGDSWIVDGDLWVYYGTTGTGIVNGFENVGRIQGIQGNEGKGITVVYATDTDGANASLTPSANSYFQAYYAGAIASDNDINVSSMGLTFYNMRGQTGAKGDSKYTWIRYADDASGNAISDSPINKKYIGIAQNKDTLTPPNGTLASAYTWAKIKGDPGDSLYTWVAYASAINGDGFDTDPAGKDYIGIKYNNTTSNQSTNPTVYTWSRIKGDTGLKGTNVMVVYSDDASGTNLNTTPGDRLYIQYVEYEEGSTPTLASLSGNGGFVRFIGTDAVITPIWAATSNPTSTTDVQLSPSTTHFYVSFFEKKITNISTDLTNNEVTAATFVRFKGEDGQSFEIKGELDTETQLTEISNSNPTAGDAYIGSGDGNLIEGNLYVFDTGGNWSNVGSIQGPEGLPSYVHIKYARDVVWDNETQGTVTSAAWTGNSGEYAGDYMGTYADNNTSDSTNATKYRWKKIKGDSLYTYVKYTSADNSTWSGGYPADSDISETPTNALYIGILNNSPEGQAPAGASNYTWTLIKGPQGIQGENGYVHIKYAEKLTGLNANAGTATGGTFTGIDGDGEVPGDYIGTYTDNISTDSTDISAYKWRYIKGSTGGTGASLYTWVAYASAINGDGFDTDPAGKDYIGISYNNALETQTTVASAYTWSRIKGATGNTGAKGDNGYLHIAFADDNQGTNFTTSNNPGDLKYIGTYTDNLSSDSEEYSDYNWVKIAGNSTTAVYATSGDGTGATLTATDNTPYVYFYVGDTLTSANSAELLSAVSPDPVYTDTTGPVGPIGPVGVTNVSIGEKSTSGRTRTYTMTFNNADGEVDSDDFTVEDGASIKTVSAVNRNNGATTITFKNDKNEEITTPSFTIDGIDHIQETVIDIGGVPGTQIDIYADSAPYKNPVPHGESQNEPKSTFRILDGDPINLVTVYAEDEGGTNASFTRGTHQFVKYHEYTNSDGKPSDTDFRPSGSHAGGFVKFVGEDAEPITPIYATNASGANASLTESAAATHINFYEGAISSIANNGDVTIPNGSSFNVSTLTFIKIKGETGATGNAGVFFNGFEPGDDFDAWTAQNDSTNGRHTITESNDKYAGTQAALIRTSNRDTNASGNVGGVYAVVPENLALLFAGKQIEVTIYAKKPSSSPVNFFQAAYSTNDVDNSEWQTFSDLTTDYKPYRFTWNVPSPNKGGTDYIGIQGDGGGRGILIDNVSIAIKAVGISSVGRNNTTGIVTVTFDDGGTDTFTVDDGADLTVTDVRRDSNSGTVTMTFSDASTKTFNVPNGVGIGSVTTSKTEGITTVIVKDDNNTTLGTFDIADGLPGSAANVLIVYADNPHGANASTVATDDNGTRKRYVRYHEYTGDTPNVSTFTQGGSNHVANSFVEYIGADGEAGDPITPIYATDASGANASLSATVNGVTRTFTNFFEGEVTSINNGIITKKSDNSTVNANTLTFVNTKGDKGDTGKTGASITQVTRDQNLIKFTITDADGNVTPQEINFYDGSNAVITNVSRDNVSGKLIFEWKNPTGVDGSGNTIYQELSSEAPLEDGVSVTGFETTEVKDSNGEVVGTRVQWLSGNGEGANFHFGKPFTIARGLPGPQAGVKIIYATDSSGSNPSYTINGNGHNREYVAYYEYVGKDDAGRDPAQYTAEEAKNAFISDGGTFAKFIGKDGDDANITTVYATDAKGSNASLSNADFNGSPRTYVTFIEEALADDTAVGAYLSANTGTTFVQLKGDPSPIYIAYHNNDIDNKPSAPNSNTLDGTGWYYHNDNNAATDSDKAIWRVEKSGADGNWGVVTKIRGEKGTTGDKGETGANGRPNGCEALPSYSNDDLNTITFDESNNELILAEHDSGGDTAIGMVYPAINCTGFKDSGKTISGVLTIKASSSHELATKLNPGVYFRAFEYDQELPAGKIAIGHSTSDSKVQEKTRQSYITYKKALADDNVSTTGYFKESFAGWATGSNYFLEGWDPIDTHGLTTGQYISATEYISIPFDYTPSPSAKYVSFGILNWNRRWVGKIDTHDEDNDGSTTDSISFNRNYVADINATAITPSDLVDSDLHNAGSYADINTTLGNSPIYNTRKSLGNNFYEGDYIKTYRYGVDHLGNSKRFLDYYGYIGEDNKSSTTSSDWELRNTTDKNIHVKPLTFDISGAKGNPGDHGITNNSVEIYKQVRVTETTAPAVPSSTAKFDIADGSVSDLDGWSVVPNDARSGYKIYRSVANAPHAANLTSGTVDIVTQDWSTPKPWSVGNTRTAPVVGRIATYNYFSSNYTNIQHNESTDEANNPGYYSFRKNAGTVAGAAGVKSGWGDGVTTSTDLITDIGQILFTNRGVNNVDNSNFWAELNQAGEFLWKYGASWILFQRKGLVDNAGVYRFVEVSVLDHSEDIQEIKDLPGFYNAGAAVNAEVVFGYTPLLKSETIYLYQRNDIANLTVNDNPSTPVEYNFDDRVIETADPGNNWTTSVAAAGTSGKYLWVTQATAAAKLDANGVYKDEIPTSEWSTPTILVQDGSKGDEGGTYFQKLLYTRTSESAPKFAGDGQWANSNYRPKDLDVAVKKHSSYSIGDVTDTTKLSSNLIINPTVWYEDIPSESLGQFIWVIIAPVISDGTANTDQITSSQWAEPVILAKDGKGLNSDTVRLYKRTSGEKPVNSNTENKLGFYVDSSSESTGPAFTYTFDSGNLNTDGVNLNGWTTGVPDNGGSTLWISRAVASGAGVSDTISWNQWQEPERLVSDGAPLVFIGAFDDRGAYQSHITGNYNSNGGIPPVNSYHIENKISANDNRRGSFLYIGDPNEASDAASKTGVYREANFVQLTVDGLSGQTGQSIVFKGTADKPGDVSSPSDGDVYRFTAPGGGSKPGLYVYESSGGGWELLTLDGDDGGAGAPGVNGNSIFICYNTDAPDPSNPPTKPPANKDGNYNGGTTTGYPDTWTTNSTTAGINWMSQKVALSATDATVDWGTPILVGGKAGEPGKRTFNITIYQRSEQKPNSPRSNEGAYDFVNDRLLVPVGWSSSIKNAGCKPKNSESVTDKDPRTAQGYEWVLPSSGDRSDSESWVISDIDNETGKMDGTSSLPLWYIETVVTATVGTVGGSVDQYDTNINWPSAKPYEINGADLVDDSVDADRVYGVVKNGGGVAKIVATDRNGNPLTQEAYDSLADSSRSDSNEYGWLAGDIVYDDTLYLIF